MKFVSTHTWPAIQRVIKDTGRHWVAVPYVSPRASRRLPLGKGDVLITRFDDDTIRAGQTDPKEIVRYIQRGVEVHNEPFLHAKVYLSTKRGVVCSANVSSNSEQVLVEAGIETVNRRAIADAKQFILQLRGAIIGLDFARKKISLFRSGRRGRLQRLPEVPRAGSNHNLWIVSLQLIEPTDAEEQAALRARRIAVTRISDPGAFKLEEFSFGGQFDPKVGDYVVQAVRRGRSVSVEAPAQILVIEPVRKKRGRGVSVVVEIRKRIRTRTLAQLDAAVRPITRKPFPRVSTYRRIANSTLRRLILAQWPHVAETNIAR